MSNLMLHCGANSVEREQVYLAQAPQSTQTWHPINHGVLLDLALDTLRDTGLVVRNEAHAMTPNQNRYFGLFEVDGGDDYGVVIGLRNAVDKAFAAGVAIGSSVFVCDNLAFDGEVQIGRKHTRGIMQDLPALVHDAINRAIEYRGDLGARLQAYRETELTQTLADHGVVELLRRGAITTKQVQKVVKEYDSPRHPEFAESNNVWRLFNAVTEINKGKQLGAPHRDLATHSVMTDLVREAA